MSAVTTARSLRVPVTSSFHTNFHSYSQHYGMGILKAPIDSYLRKLHNRTMATMVPTRAMQQSLEQRGYKNVRLESVIPGTTHRADVLALDGDLKPEMASLTLSSLNFLTSASINAPETVRELARIMRDRDIVPELEVFDLGMLNFASVLRKEGLLAS